MRKNASQWICLGVLAACCLMTGCDSLGKAVDFCEGAMSCGYTRYQSVDECINTVEAEYDDYPGCESKIEVYYDCVKKNACSTSSTISWSCGIYKAQLDECEGVDR